MNKTQIEGIEVEVVAYDSYQVKHLDFVPDVVFDIGSNVGVFAKFARQLWKNALIVAIEPDRENIAQNCMKGAENVVLLQKAIGHGRIWRINHGDNHPELSGAQECYHSIMLGYPKEAYRNETYTVPVETKSITLDVLAKYYLKEEGHKFILKIDCEGGENAIFDHEPSMDVMRKADYIAMEVHNYGSSHEENEKVKAKINESLTSLEATHNCRRVDFMFYARKK